MTSLLNESINTQIRAVFENLQNPVHLLFFGRKEDCEYCGETRQLVEEVAALSEKLTVSIHDLKTEPETARKYQMDKAPGIIIAAEDGDTITDLGIHYAGIPSGYEFNSFIQDILLASSRDSGLSANTRAFLQALTEPLHLQVFVTPT
jgi:alkyl hydroperoxide reductase subunit AhpF